MLLPRLFGSAHAVGRYETEAPFARAIRRYKYNGRVELAEPFGRLLEDAFRSRWAQGEMDAAAPVPLHPSKLRKRGFNQAYLPIRPWERTRPLGVRVDRDLLRRVRKTRSQAGLSAREREENLRGAFRLRPGAEVMGKRILLVDDVLTTGATAGACAEVLRYAGAAAVDVLTLGRTPGPLKDEDD
jgi:ComF family protein